MYRIYVLHAVSICNLTYFLLILLRILIIQGLLMELSSALLLGMQDISICIKYICGGTPYTLDRAGDTYYYVTSHSTHMYCVVIGNSRRIHNCSSKESEFVNALAKRREVSRSRKRLVCKMQKRVLNKRVRLSHLFLQNKIGQNTYG